MDLEVLKYSAIQEADDSTYWRSENPDSERIGCTFAGIEAVGEKCENSKYHS
jgi:hypothetical protein